MRKNRNSFIVDGLTTTLIVTRRNGDIYNYKIDTEDLDRIKKHGWAVCGSRNNYLQACVNGKNEYIHHFLIGKKDGNVVDHINRDPYDNRKNNLRHCSISSNNQNRTIGNKHGFPGLSYIPEFNGSYTGTYSNKVWQVRIRVKRCKSNSPGGTNTKLIHVGVFETKEEAIAARRIAEKKYFGEVMH